MTPTCESLRGTAVYVESCICSAEIVLPFEDLHSLWRFFISLSVWRFFISLSVNLQHLNHLSNSAPVSTTHYVTMISILSSNILPSASSHQKSLTLPLIWWSNHGEYAYYTSYMVVALDTLYIHILGDLLQECPPSSLHLQR